LGTASGDDIVWPLGRDVIVGGLTVERCLVEPIPRAFGWAALLVGAMLNASLGAAAQPTDPSAPEDSHPMAEVQITASKLDEQTLKRVTTQFAKSHGAASAAVHQIGRWRMDVCPGVTGLQPAASAFVSRRVTEIARSVGAPTRKAGKDGKDCTVNVKIVFTSEPQQLLDHVAKAYPDLLGSSRSPGDAISRHAIQSWYVTGTKVDGWNSIATGSLASMLTGLQMGVDASTPGGAIASDGARVDPAYGTGFTGFGRSGSYFSKGFASELLQVFVVVDTGKVAGNSLSSISDYIAMLALTRMNALDGCNTLSSIIDLLSSGCSDRQKPQTLTDADTAYLKALYSSNLEMNLNLEQGDIRDRMVKAISGR
jgi:hypothetical protein